MLNLLTVQLGDVVLLKDGSRAEVVENIGDGIWLQLRDLASGDENLVHCEEMLSLEAGDARTAPNPIPTGAPQHR